MSHENEIDTLEYESHGARVINIGTQFEKACERGDLHEVKYFLTSSSYTNLIDVYYNHGNGARLSIENHHLELLKFLLTGKEIKENLDINVNNNSLIHAACEYGHLDIVDYLLKSPDLKTHASFQSAQDTGFFLACANGHLNVLRYLNNIEENTPSNLKTPFLKACESFNKEIVEFFLYDLNFKINPEIKIEIKEWVSNKEHLEEIYHMIDKRDLFIKINTQFELKEPTKSLKL